MTNIHQPNTPAPNGADPIERAARLTHEAGGGTRSPQKHGPGPMHDDDDMKHKRGGGDVERGNPEDEDEGGRRHGGRSQPDMDEEKNGGRSRQGPGRSRNT